MQVKLTDTLLTGDGSSSVLEAGMTKTNPREVKGEWRGRNHRKGERKTQKVCGKAATQGPASGVTATECPGGDRCRPGREKALVLAVETEETSEAAGGCHYSVAHGGSRYELSLDPTAVANLRSRYKGSGCRMLDFLSTWRMIFDCDLLEGFTCFRV